jgi:hypothetical protein
MRSARPTDSHSISDQVLFHQAHQPVGQLGVSIAQGCELVEKGDQQHSGKVGEQHAEQQQDASSPLRLLT